MDNETAIVKYKTKGSSLKGLIIFLVIVIAIVLLSILTLFIVKRQQKAAKIAKENQAMKIMKNEALVSITNAGNLYAEISSNSEDSRTFLKISDDSKYQAMCVTLNGLSQNGFNSRDLKNGELRGVILIEVPFEYSETKKTIWMTNGNAAITGYGEKMIKNLEYKAENDKQLNNDYFGVINRSKQFEFTEKAVKDEKTFGLVKDISKADQIITLAHGTETTATSESIHSCKYNGMSNQKCLLEEKPDKNGYDSKKSTHRVISKFYAAPVANGGTGAVYTNIVCINADI